jgi:SAM-dependent methyltransferase
MVIRAAGPRLAADEEALPFKRNSFDLIISLLNLHWINDLPGALLQIRSALKADGLFLGAMLGGRTLHELRHALAEAEIAAEGGLSPRISPFADIRDAGDLLQRAGFTLPVVDTETLSVIYPCPVKLMSDLRGMGETNATIGRRKTFTRRQTLLDGITRYRNAYSVRDGTVPATFQVLYLSGWSPPDAQPTPSRRGSPTMRLGNALGSS